MLWFALLMSSLMMVGVLASQHGIDEAVLSSEDLWRADVLVFCIMGGINFVVSFFIPKLLTRLNPQFKQYPENEDILLKLSFLPFLLRLALAEAVTIFGFIAAMSVGKTLLVLPFFGLTLMVFFLSFPRYELFRSWFRRP